MSVSDYISIVLRLGFSSVFCFGCAHLKHRVDV